MIAGTDGIDRNGHKVYVGLCRRADDKRALGLVVPDQPTSYFWGQPLVFARERSQPEAHRNFS